jgi:predicted HTH domain antitoxin
MTTLQIPIDDRWLLRAGMTVNELAGELREFLAAKLYESGRLTLGQAAEMAGQPVWSFMETISRMGVSVINMDIDMLKHDLAAA